MRTSIDRAGPFIRRSLQMPGHSLTAAQVLTYWNSFLTTAVATSTATGAPRVAPTGVALWHGKFIVPTVAEASRTKATRGRPEVSLSHFDEGSLAIIIHGRSAPVDQGEEFDEICAFHRRVRDGEDVTRWEGTGLYLSVTPATIFTFAREPERFPA